MSDLPVQPSLRRLRQFEVRPKRSLGQNFLIDSNVLDVIARLVVESDSTLAGLFPT